MWRRPLHVLRQRNSLVSRIDINAISKVLHPDSVERLKNKHSIASAATTVKPFSSAAWLGHVNISTGRTTTNMAEPFWRQFGNEELDKLYRNSVWSQRLPADEMIAEHIRILTAETERVYKSVDCERDIPYGPTEREKLDIFGATSLPKDAPVFVWIHGGYWQYDILTRKQNGMLVRPLVTAGAVVVVIGYELAPKAKLDEIIHQVRTAIVYALKFAKERGSRGVYYGGHSAGGHLTASVMATDWTEFPDADPTLLKGMIPVSGVYDIRPLVYTTVNAPLGLTEEDAWRNSPEKYMDRILKNCQDAKVTVVVGGEETPEFHRQAKELNQALVAGGVNSNYVEIAGFDHFNITEELRNPDHRLTKEIVALMGL